MERLNEKMGQLKAEFISRDGLRFNKRKKKHECFSNDSTICHCNVE